MPAIWHNINRRMGTVNAPQPRSEHHQHIMILSAEQLTQSLAKAHYIADAQLATTLSLMMTLQRPLLLEGDAGVGKTALATAFSQLLDTELIRIQCYEGLDADQILVDRRAGATPWDCENV